MMGNSVEQCRGHFGIAEHLYPFCEVEIGGDNQRGFFIELADQVKQQSPTRCWKRQITQFIQNHCIHCGQLFGQIAGVTVLFFLVEQSMLYNWVAKSRQTGQLFEDQKLQQAELARFRRENAQLEQELAFVKKAAAYLAKNPS